MQTPPSLLEIQTWLKWIITDPRGVDGALSGNEVDELLVPSRYIEPQPRLLEKVIESSGVTRVQRLSVYAEGYFSRIFEALQTDFPDLQNALGDQFPRVCADYLEMYPSHSPNIEDIGRNLPAFLRTYLKTKDRPDLHEIADLEWGKIEAFYAPVSSSLNLSALQNISEEDWTKASFTLCPSMRLFSFEHPQAFILIQRTQESPVVHHIDKHQFLIIKALSKGETLDEILSGLTESSSTQVTSWFSQWVQSGLITEVQLK